MGRAVPKGAALFVWAGGRYDLVMTTVLFVAFPGITQLDMTGPAQFLSRLPGATTIVAGEQIGPIVTDSGFAIAPTMTFADAPQADILCVPGGHGVAEAVGNAALLDFVARQAAGAKWVTSVCTGAFVLGRAGLLEGKRATTHWAYAHLLPLVGATHEPARVVEDGHTITAGGVTAGIDFALTLIAREAGEATARGIQLALEYDPAPPFHAGTPGTADPKTTAFLKQKVYDAAAAKMAAALTAGQ
jgi:cyclohexyl-isocyanide hydratase